MRCVTLLTLVVLIAHTVTLHAEDADEVREKGIAALKDSQTNPRAIVDAARFFVRAAALYGEAGNEEKNVEVNSFLYWCKKKMTLADIEQFTKGGEDAVASKLAAVEKAAPKVDDAPKWFDRADQFAKKNPDEHLLIAIRFYEIADRFKGSDLSLQAQDRSLKEITLEKTGSRTAVNDPAPTPAVPLGKKVPLPTPARQKEIEKTIREIYKADFAKTTSKDKLAFAAKLDKEADGPANDSESRYVLLTQAAIVAAQAGDMNCLLPFFDKLMNGYESDFKDFRKVQLSAIVKASDPKLAKLASFMKLLIDNPEDAPANLAVGKYYLSVGDEDRAFKMIEKSKNDALSDLAKREQSAPPEGAAQTGLADAWWDLGEKSLDKDDKNLYRVRALYWYNKALPSMNGIGKIKIEKRIDDAEASIPRKTIDLLSTLDLTRDRITGGWKPENGTLVANNPNVGILQLAYLPPEEYDLITEVSVTGGLLTWILVGGGNQFELGMGSNDGSDYAGFELVDGKYANANETTRAFTFVAKKKYKVVIKVRRSKVSVFVADKLVTEMNTNYQNVALHPNWSITNKHTLAIGNFRGTGTYFAITVREITGTGKRSP